MLFSLILVLGLVIPASAETVLEPWTYQEDFEDRDLGAWASYPLWQDIAYDPNVRVYEIVPGDPNIAFEQKVTPYTNVDNYTGAEKLLDMYLVPGSTISFRYYLKSHLPFEYFTVRLAAGKDGKIDFKIPDPPLNRWEWITVSFEDFVRENPRIAGNDRIRVNALAVLGKVPDADPEMQFYLGLDDITVKGMRATAFQFAEPAVYKLPEWAPYIPQTPYHKGENLSLSGYWPVDADRVSLEVAMFTDASKKVYSTTLSKKSGQWVMKPWKLNIDNGLYLATLTAWDGKESLSSSQFTIHVMPDVGGMHPRTLYDADQLQEVKARLNNDKFAAVREQIAKNAASQRERVKVEDLIYDLDQFPDTKWLPTWSAWGSRIYNTDNALLWNSLAYTWLGDEEAGRYAKDVLLKLSTWHDWTHPWQTKRGRFSEHRTGSWSHRLALAYDAAYDLMTEPEREQIRAALLKNIVKGAYRTYVYNNNITAQTSNWIAMVAGGSLMVQSAMYGDGDDVANLEPYFTATAMKLWAFLTHVADPEGAWGEGLGYNNYSFHNLSMSLPTLDNVFNIDMSYPIRNTTKEYIWAGYVKDKRYFHYGDSGGNLNPIDYWAWLLPRYEDPMLGWYYNFLNFGKVVSNTKTSVRQQPDTEKKDYGWVDVLYETVDVPQDDPFDENPVKVFKEVGTTVFKSGWETDDMVFVMRTGAFYNHQHIDQGSFWYADRGSIFVEERHNSTYYDDPLYQPWYTQPIAHSTILIDGNHQSQRVGDHQVFAEGFDDHAFIYQFLDGQNAAFSSGDIGRLYWGKVDCMRRNVLYLKPRTILMLDTIVPSKRDVDVTLLYQTERLEDIVAGENVSTITKDGNVMNIVHVYPDNVTAESVMTPHYLYTLREDKPLVKEGMLTVTARTNRNPLVMANFIRTTTGAEPDITAEEGTFSVSGTADGVPYAFSTWPGRRYEAEGFATDAAAVTWSGDTVFAALCTELVRNGKTMVTSEKPMTCEVASGSVKYCLAADSAVSIGCSERPATVTVNGEKVSDYRWDAEKSTVILTVEKGEGLITF